MTAAAPSSFAARKTQLHRRAVALLEKWLRYAEGDWIALPGEPALGFYGTGFNGWGVQTQQKYLAAAAAVARFSCDEPLRALARERALAALRWNLAAHRSGSGSCSDGSRWGHTWISVLGIERMMFGVELLKTDFTDADHEALRRVLCSEAEWLLHDYHRGAQKGIHGDVWGSSGKNDPESNLWNGAFLWRVASLYPEHPDAAAWRERAHLFMLNGVSVAADAGEERLVEGVPLRERHRGANFFPHYALDHHGYFNVGYMIICLSNAALLHFDLKKAGQPAPESLHHHQADLWKFARELVFEHGRLARIGGDTRVRYAYCQDFLLPALLYAADRLGDGAAWPKVEGLMELFEGEARYSGDGSFFARRLAPLRRANLHYHARLESDRACVLAMLLAYGDLLEAPAAPVEPPPPFDWAEPEYGAAFVRSPRRLASFAWRAQGLAQGMCLPPGGDHLAEWSYNLAGKVEFAHHPIGAAKHPEPSRKLDGYAVASFPGGFLTRGRLVEGADLFLLEGWKGSDAAHHALVFAALPDERTVVGLQFCRTTPQRYTLLKTVKGLHLNLPNDLYNGFQRRLETGAGPLTLEAPAPREERLDLGSRWACIEGELGVVGIAGAEELSIHREPLRRGGTFESLHVEEVCFPAEVEPRLVAPGTVVLDAAWAVLSGADATETAGVAAGAVAVETGPSLHESGLRGVRVPGADARHYTVLVNFGAEPVLLPQALTEAAGNLLAATGETDPGTLGVGETQLYCRE
ncbi:MAG TPA: hypothetical protein VNQ90_16665 [Chthoniobacteraceae bacterium]|nr:hypothetical protein [Chthoniobacteraceae bacterium]